MKFEELTKAQQKQVLKEISEAYKDDGFENPMERAKEYAKEVNFQIVDYSPDEDGSDLRVEW